MNCLIDDIISSYLKKGKKIEAIRRYIKMKYNISIDAESIKGRMKTLQLKSSHRTVRMPGVV